MYGFQPQIYLQVRNVEYTVVSVHVRTVYSTVITTCRQFMVHGNKCKVCSVQCAVMTTQVGVS